MGSPYKGGLAAILLTYILVYEIRKQRKNRKRNQPDNINNGQNENLII